MSTDIAQILRKKELAREDIIRLLQVKGEEQEALLDAAYRVKAEYVGKYTYFRGLIEFSNICSKDCFYCGIRRGNKKVQPYVLSDEEVMQAVRYSAEKDWGSVVIQAGERSDTAFIERIDSLIKQIKAFPGKELGITLSLGDQDEATYRRWFASGAHRYLLRIESANPELYTKLHPCDARHDFQRRLDSLKLLQKCDYHTGTGVMIGLPSQTYDDLAGDLLFIRDMDIDMIGMGPYIEHEDTPLYKYRDTLMPLQERFELALRMTAVLRLLMKDVNIAAATALQAIHPHGRERALRAGANVIMPNLTPVKYHGDYSLYLNKPTVNEETDAYVRGLEAHIHAAGDEIGYGTWGDPVHYKTRTGKEINK